LGTETVESISEYSKLLLPVMTAALAAQGGIGTSAGIYMLSAAFHSLLSAMISRVIMPLIYIYLSLAIANSVLSSSIIGKLKDGIQWLTVWGLKIILYIFTALISITGIVSGAADASAVKAAKITISGMVPVIGSIISDASETILVSAQLMKNATGVYGLLTVAALFLSPFLKIGIQYILLKITWFLSDTAGGGSAGKLVGDFSSALGMVLAMIACQSLFVLVSTVCFMKGVG